MIVQKRQKSILILTWFNILYENPDYLLVWPIALSSQSATPHLRRTRTKVSNFVLWDFWYSEKLKCADYIDLSRHSGSWFFNITCFTPPTNVSINNFYRRMISHKYIVIGRRKPLLIPTLKTSEAIFFLSTFNTKILFHNWIVLIIFNGLLWVLPKYNDMSLIYHILFFAFPWFFNGFPCNWILMMEPVLSTGAYFWKFKS